jgi:hypothetical protein
MRKRKALRNDSENGRIQSRPFSGKARRRPVYHARTGDGGRRKACFAEYTVISAIRAFLRLALLKESFNTKAQRTQKKKIRLQINTDKHG